MSIPGFTASISLYSSSGRYRAAVGHSGAPAGTQAVVPQLKRQLDLLLCLQGCSLAGSDPFCADTCYRMDHIGASDEHGSGGGGGVGGGGGPRCRPACTPCRRDLESETGRSKTCVRADCDTTTFAC